MRKLVCIVHYNTPELTRYTIRSVRKWTPDSEIVIFDNSDRLPWQPMEEVECIDNTAGQLIDFDKWLAGIKHKKPSPGNNYGSAKHCYSVQWLMDYFNEPFILIDSDVLIRKDISQWWDNKVYWAGDVSCNTHMYGYSILKIDPWFCYLNVPKLKAKGVTYFNQEYMWDLCKRKPNHLYDTGAWLFKQCTKMKLPYKGIPLKQYTFHLRHASWKNTEWRGWVELHKETWE